VDSKNGIGWFIFFGIQIWIMNECVAREELEQLRDIVTRCFVFWGVAVDLLIDDGEDWRHSRAVEKDDCGGLLLLPGTHGICGGRRQKKSLQQQTPAIVPLCEDGQQKKTFR
jgi:hypothetical protein